MQPAPHPAHDTTARLWSRNFLLLTLANFAIFLAFYCLLPTMPIFIKSLGGSDSIVGIVAGVFTISAVLIRLWGGQAIDTGNRRLIFYGALLLFICTFAGYRWAAAILPLFLLRVLHGFSWGVLTTATGTFAADIVPAARRGEGMGYFGVSTSLAMIAGPALGISLLTLRGYPALFFAATAIAFAGLLLTLGMRIPGGHGASQRIGLRGIFEVKALSLSLIMLLSGMVYGGVVLFISLYAVRNGLGTGASFFSVFAVCMLLFRPLSGRAFDRFGATSVLVPGLLLCTLGVLLLGAWPTGTVFYLAAVVLGAGFGAVQPSLQAMVIHRVPPQRRGAATATLMSALDLGIGLGAMALGVIAEMAGYGMMYLASSIPGLLALIWFGLCECRAR